MRILLVDDHEMFREGLRAMLEQQTDLEVVGEAGNGREAVDLVAKMRALMNECMPATVPCI